MENITVQTNVFLVFLIYFKIFLICSFFRPKSKNRNFQKHEECRQNEKHIFSLCVLYKVIVFHKFSTISKCYSKKFQVFKNSILKSYVHVCDNLSRVFTYWS